MCLWAGKNFEFRGCLDVVCLKVKDRRDFHRNLFDILEESRVEEDFNEYF